MEIAFIGTGRMGGPMVRRLLDAAHDVVVCDLDPAARRAAVGHGARVASTPAEAASEASFVLCSLPTPEVTENVVCDALSAVVSGTIVVDLGTGDPATARRLATACERKRARFLDAPVSRGVPAAETGTLAMLVGGDEEVLAAARPVLDVLAADVVHVGGVGAGQVAKLCNNMLAAIHAAALGEVLVAGVSAGVDLDALAAAIRAGSGSSYVLEDYLPRGLFTVERPTGFALALMRKDVGLFLRAGAEMGVTLPVSGLVQHLYAAARSEGLDEADWTSVAEVYERMAGVRLSL